MNGGYDRNQDGVVSNSRELSFVDDKPAAKSDLDGLSAFDSNRDGLFSSADAAISVRGKTQMATARAIRANL